MGRKAPKSAKKFATSGQLKKTIQARHKHQKALKRTQHRRGNKGGVKGAGDEHAEDDEEEEEESSKKTARGSKVKSVDDFLNGGFMNQDDDDEEDDDEDEDMGDEGSEMDDDEDAEDDDDDFASVDDIDDEGAAHLLELSKLAEKDPEFFKYLQENDRELLEFKAGGAADADSGDEDAVMQDAGDDDEDDETPVLDKELLRKWQKALLDHRSLRALRKLLIAFRSAAHMNEDDQVVAWKIDSSLVYDKLVVTALRYTPVVLAYHCPYKTLPNGRLKAPTQTPKLRSLQKMIISFFQNATHLLSQVPEKSELLKIAVTESAKIVPYVASSRRAVRAYVKKCLELWSTASVPDEVRISAYLAVKTVSDMGEESSAEAVMKNMYLTFVRTSKLTTPFTLPSITLMKNSAADMFCVPELAGTAYQLAFGYIRQLAIHLRNSVKVKTKEAYKLVYNWQYVHCIDFWCLVLAKSCSKSLETQSEKESDLKPLIYPLVQVALGAIKLIPNSRSYPLHLHLLRSLVHLTKHTSTYIPLFPFLLPILSSSLSPTSKPKNSTLKPLDLESTIRCPAQYNKTRVYLSALVEEASYVLAEYLASDVVRGSVAFPEVCVPIQVALRKVIKGSSSSSSASSGKKGKGGAGGVLSKEIGTVKTLVERIDDASAWVSNKRNLANASKAFGPANMDAVRQWEREMGREEGPLGKYVKTLRKTREARRKLIEKAREGQDEILGEEDEDEDSEMGSGDQDEEFSDDE